MSFATAPYTCEPLPARTYLENLHEAMIEANKTALHYRDGKAWDNAKRKTRKRMAPRGPFFRKFEKAEHSRKGNAMISGIKATLADIRGE